MLDFNVGELTTRLRAALGVRGRMPLGLDEHCMPTVATADVSGPPWRRTGLGFTGSAMSTVIAAGNGANVALVPTVLTGAFVLTGYQIAALSFVNATPTVAVVDNAVALWYLPQGAPAIVAPNSSLCISTENYADPVNPVIIANEVPLSIQTGRSIGAYAAIQGDNLIAVVRQVSLDSFAPWTPCEIVIRPTTCLVATTIPLASATDTTRVLFNFRGNFYPGI